MSKVIVDEIQTDTTDGSVRIIPNGTGKLEVKGAGGDDAMLQLNCSAQTHGVKLKSPAHSASQSYTMILPDNQIAADKVLKVKSITGSGATAVGQLEFADAGGGGGLSSDSRDNTIGGTDAGTNLDLSTSNSWETIDNTLLGHDAGKAMTTGYRNTIVGSYAGSTVTTGYRNVYIGTETGGHNTSTGTNNSNVAVGDLAGYNLENAANNTLVGNNAGSVVTSGYNNLCIGSNSGGFSAPSGNITTGNNNICLGDNNINNFYCADTSISSSDSRDKTDVTSFTIGLDWIEALRPVTYRWDRRTWYGTDEEPYGTPDGSKKRQRLHIGFLAQEALAVEQANGYGTSNDDSLILNLTDDGMSYGMKYERLVPILVNAIKELSARVKTLEGG